MSEAPGLFAERVITFPAWVASRPARLTVTLDRESAWGLRVRRVVLAEGDDEQRQAIARLMRSLDGGIEFLEMAIRTRQLARTLDDIERAVFKAL